MTTRAASWQPLSPGERSVAIEVLVHGPLSRTELARRLDLSAGSLTRLTKPLIESGLLVEVPDGGGPAEVRQGRPSQPLDVVAESRTFLGFKITEDMVYGVVTTLRSEIVARLDRPLTTHDPDEVADLLAEMTAELPPLPHASPASASVSAVSSRTVPWWGSRPSSTGATSRWPNSSRSAPGCRSSSRTTSPPSSRPRPGSAPGRGLDRFVVLTIGAGIGYGLVLGGKRVPYAEEDRGFGRHWILNPNGPLTPPVNAAAPSRC
jgi:DNA-binding transcriptional ArsR family regulator